MVEKIKNWVESDRIGSDLNKLKTNIDNKLKNKLDNKLDNKNDSIILDEFKDKIIDNKLDLLKIRANKKEKITNSDNKKDIVKDWSQKNKLDNLRNKDYLAYDDNETDRWTQAIKVLEDVAASSQQKNIFARFFGGIANKLLK